MKNWIWGEKRAQKIKVLINRSNTLSATLQTLNKFFPLILLTVHFILYILSNKKKRDWECLPWWRSSFSTLTLLGNTRTMFTQHEINLKANQMVINLHMMPCWQYLSQSFFFARVKNKKFMRWLRECEPNRYSATSGLLLIYVFT